LVEEELAGGGALLDGEGGEGGRFFVGGEHLVEVDIAEDVDVVQKEGFAGVPFLEKPGGFFEAAAGVEEEIVFAGEFDAEAEIAVGLEKADDFFGVVMDVDDDFGDAEGFETGDEDFEEGAAV